MAFGTNLSWGFFNFPVKAVLNEGILHFLYYFPAHDPLSFSVHDADKIYLNLIILLSLIGATWFTFKRKILKSALISLFLLYVFHIFILFLYAYTHIWEFLELQSPEVQKELGRHVADVFTKDISDMLLTIRFHWNTWGWDVSPLLIWLGIILKNVPQAQLKETVIQYLQQK
jgi:hypothetical protein